MWCSVLMWRQLCGMEVALALYFAFLEQVHLLRLDLIMRGQENCPVATPIAKRKHVSAHFQSPIQTMAGHFM
jgi:hypothetical protein